MVGIFRHPARPSASRSPFWNGAGRDPEGSACSVLTGAAGNHGEDVIGSLVGTSGRAAEPRALALALTPTRRVGLPYEQLSPTAAGWNDPRARLLDTGAFDDNRFGRVDVTSRRVADRAGVDAIELENHGRTEGDDRRAATCGFRQHLVVGRRRRSVRRLEGDGSAFVRSRTNARSPGYRLRRTGPGPRRAGSREALFCGEETKRAAGIRVRAPTNAVPEGRDSRPRVLGAPTPVNPGTAVRHEGGEAALPLTNVGPGPNGGR